MKTDSAAQICCTWTSASCHVGGILQPPPRGWFSDSSPAIRVMLPKWKTICQPLAQNL